MLMQNERLKVVSPHSFSGWIVRSRVRRERRGRNYTTRLTEISKINSCKLLEQEDMVADRSDKIKVREILVDSASFLPLLASLN
jgi:hypothetical protein